jgi:hypothetical protein
VIRWLLDGTRVTQLARDHQIGRSTCDENLHEALGVLAEQAPGLHSALLAAKMADYDYVITMAPWSPRTVAAHPAPPRGGSVVVGQTRAGLV